MFIVHVMLTAAPGSITVNYTHTGSRGLKFNQKPVLVNFFNCQNAKHFFFQPRILIAKKLLYQQISKPRCNY